MCVRAAGCVNYSWTVCLVFALCVFHAKTGRLGGRNRTEWVVSDLSELATRTKQIPHRRFGLRLP